MVLVGGACGTRFHGWQTIRKHGEAQHQRKQSRLKTITLHKYRLQNTHKIPHQHQHNNLQDEHCVVSNGTGAKHRDCLATHLKASEAREGVVALTNTGHCLWDFPVGWWDGGGWWKPDASVYFPQSI